MEMVSILVLDNGYEFGPITKQLLIRNNICVTSTKDIGSAESLILFTRFSIKKLDMLDIKPKCRAVICCPMTNIDHLPTDTSRSFKIFKLNSTSRRVQSISSSAEYTFALTVSALKHIPRNLGASGADKVRFKERMWLRQVREVRDFSSTTVGVVGFGRNGKKVAHYLKSLGISLAYFDPYVLDDRYDRAISLKALIQKAGCIVLTLTSDELTEGIIHAGLFADIKSTRIIVNTSRPNVVDSASIYPLIKTKKLTYISDFPLKLGNGQISRDYEDGYFWSHHVAGASRDSTDKADFDVLFKAIRFLRERRK